MALVFLVLEHELVRISDFGAFSNCAVKVYYMASLIDLTKVAAVIGVVAGSFGIFFTKNYESKIRNSITYKRALEKVYNHEKTIEHLGKPVKEGRITIGNSKDNENTRNFTVNLKGSNTKAKLNCEFIIKEPNKTTELTKLEIKFNNLPNKMFVIHEI
nr:uncharacterized protein LOC117608566 [Osmia lignaria]